MTDTTLPTAVEAPSASMEELMALKAEKDELLAKQAEIDERMASVREGSRANLVEHLRALIVDTGFTFAEIVPHLDPAPAKKPRAKRGSKKAAEGKGSGNYPTYIDPTNPANMYKRGVLPAWFKDKMAALGLDPAKKEDREVFKSQHLQVVQPAAEAPVEAQVAPAAETHNA